MIAAMRYDLSQGNHNKLKMTTIASYLALFVFMILFNNSASRTAGESLKLYVDPLPTIPRIYGYSNDSGHPKPIKLTIGMFAKKWVIIAKNI